MSQVKRSDRKVLLFVSAAAMLSGGVLHFSLVLASGVNLMFTSKVGFAVAAWGVSPALAFLALVLFLGGFVGMVINLKR